MKKTLINALSLLLTIIVLTACGADSASKEPSPSTPAPATVAPTGTDAASQSPKPESAEVGPDGRSFENFTLNERYTLRVVRPTQYNEIIFADRQGFLDEVGLDVEYIGALPQNVSLAQAVSTGLVDVFGSGHTTTIVNARQAGVNLKIVNAATVDSSDFAKTHMTWFVREDSDIQTPADLKGKTIAVGSLGGCVELWNAELLRQNNLTVDDVTVTVISSELAQEQALRQKQVDVIVIHGPNNKVAYENGGLRILAKSYDIAEGAGDGSLSAVGVRAFTEEFIEKHPAVVRAYITAVNRAQVWAANNYEESLAVAADFLEVDESLITGTDYTKSLWVEADKIKFWVDSAETNKLAGFENPGQVNPEELYTNEYNLFYTGELTQ